MCIYLSGYILIFPSPLHLHFEVLLVLLVVMVLLLVMVLQLGQVMVTFLPQERLLGWSLSSPQHQQ